MRFGNALAGAFAVVATLAVACSSSSSSGSSSSSSSSSGSSPSNPTKVDVRPVAMSAEGRAASEAYATELEVLKIASVNYTLDLTKALPPLDVSGAQAEALATAVHAHAAWLATASALSGTGGSGTGAGPGGMGVLTLHPRTTGVVRSAIFGIDDAIVIAGLAIAAWGAAKGVHKAVEIRTAPTGEKIETASSGDLAVINQSLGLPSTATKAEAKKAFDDLGMGARLAKAKLIEQDLRLAETNNTPDVQSIPAEKLQRAVAESSVECGKTAVKATVSASTFSGQGYSQAAQALGATERAGNVIDLTISAVSEATNVPLQPLDRLANHLEGTVASKTRETVTLPPAPAGVTPDAATQVLSTTDPTLSEFVSAIDAKIRSVVDPLISLIGAIAKGDGTLSVNQPSRIHQVVVDGATNVQVVQIPSVGAATLIVATDCHGTTSYDVDTGGPLTVPYSIAENTCAKGDCSAVLQLVDSEVTLPAECERCINSTCGGQCTACDPTCVETVDRCYQKCDDSRRACHQSCAGCSGEGCYSQCLSSCASVDVACDDKCGAMPEAAKSDAIGTCIQGPCGEACASAIK